MSNFRTDVLTLETSTFSCTFQNLALPLNTYFRSRCQGEFLSLETVCKEGSSDDLSQPNSPKAVVTDFTHSTNKTRYSPQSPVPHIKYFK